MNQVAYLIVVLVLTSHLNVNQASQPPSIKIGFSCCHFYDLDSGSPVFMQGEEIWVQAEENVSVVLHNPTTDVTYQTMSAHSSTQLYTFKPDDPPGQWELEAHSESGNRAVPIYLVNPQASASTTQIGFRLNVTQLIAKGTVAINTPNEGGFIMLTREFQNPSIDLPPSPFRWGDVHASISWDPLNPRILNVAPYAPALTTSNITTVWAEVSQEISLLKQVGKNQVLTIAPQIVTKTNRASLNLQAAPKEVITIELPTFHGVGLNGQAPLRLGPVHVALFVERDKTIYVLESDAFLLGNGVVSSVADMIEIPPLLSTLGFQLKDNLQTLSNYSLVLIAKQTGANTIWTEPVIPPVARFQVLNTLTDQLIQDYTLSSDEFREVTKVGNQTYAIPANSHTKTEIALSIGGISLETNEFQPQSILPEPLSTFTIRASASTVILRVEDVLGSAPTSGTLKLARTTGSGESSSTEKTWGNQSGMISLTLPLGRYELQLGIEGSTIQRQFSVNQAEEHVNFTLTELTLTQTRNSLIIAGAVAAVIAVEAVIALRIWKSFSKSRKGRQGTHGSKEEVDTSGEAA